MVRRGMGRRGLKKMKEKAERAQQIGDKLEGERVEYLATQMTTFKEKLEEFAKKHKKEINSDPQFRHYFHQMCTDIGVDPLASSKGFWAELLGVGDFYYELGIQIVEVCLQTKRFNGGLMELDDLLVKIQTKKRGKRITVQDIETAISKLKVLGNGFKIIKLGNKRVVKSVPAELNKDHHDVLRVAEGSASCTVTEVIQALKWPKARIKSVLKMMLDEGMAWIDTQDVEVRYWFPCLWNGEMF